MTPPPATPPKIPDYELLKPIGRGSYGEVWLARSVTGVFRIIKVVRRDRFDDERPYRRELEGISRFQAAVSGRPRQLALLHVGRNDEAGYFYYVMEPADDAETGSAIDPERYIPLTLGELFKRRGRLPAAECVQLALELARGLAVLHAENLIHRDIKPSNIIFVQRVPKLADVGLVATSDTAMTCVGTLGYSPPEGPGSVSADLYGLGKVLYEIATGLDRLEYPRLPADIADTSDAPLLREINALVLRTCDRDPDQRPASAEAFARDLELIQAGQSVAFYEALRRRLRFFATAAALIAVLTAVGATLTLWRSSLLFAAKERNRNALYISDLAVAQLAITTGESDRARAALLRQIPEPGDSDLRNFEWYILAHAVRGDGKPLETAGTRAAVRNLVADRSGRWLAAGFANDTATIWDLGTGRVARRLTDVRVLGGFTTDGLLVVDEPARALRFESPTNGTVRRIDTGRRLYDLLDNDRFNVVTPRGDIIVAILQPNGTETPSGFNLSKQHPSYGLSASCTTPDGRYYITGLYKEEGAHRTRRIAVIDLVKREEIWHRDVPGRIPWVIPSPDSSRFAANVGGLSPVIYGISGTSASISLKGHTARAQAAAFSPDCEVVATVSADQTLQTWNSRTGELISAYRALSRPGTAVTWLRNGKNIVTGDDQGELLVFQHPTTVVPTMTSGYYSDIHGDIEFSGNSQHIAISHTRNTIALVSSSDLHRIQVVSNVFQPIFFSKDSRSLFAFGSDWSVRRITFPEYRNEVVGSVLPPGFSVASWSKSRQRDIIAMLGTEGRFFVFNPHTSALHHQQEPDKKRFWAAAFSGDGSELWTANTLGVLRKWRSSDGLLLGEVNRVSGEAVAMDVSPDGKWIAVGLAEDASIRILNRSENRWLAPLFSHRRFPSALCFSEDGTRLISGGTDGRAIVWRTLDFQEVAAFDVGTSSEPTGDEGIAVLRNAPDWSSIAAFTEDGRLKLWRIR